MKIIAVVIWYNPEKKMVDNLLSYSKYISKTIVVDNSNCNNSKLIEGEKNIEYIALQENFGVAAALNFGYMRAEELGAEWVLTMDQDSSFKMRDIENYIRQSADHFKQTDVAIYGPNFEGLPIKELVECDSVITSGSLVSLAAHKINVGYNEKLFIDQVDHEYCFRLKRLGYRILKVGNISMNHTIGSPLKRKRFKRIFISYNHEAIRKYYITRNMLYMRKNFKEYGDKHIKMLIMDIVNIIFIEENKIEKIKYMFMGIYHYMIGKMGSLK